MSGRKKDDQHDPVVRLVPARPQSAEESRRYLPHLPWRYMLIAGAVLLIVIGGFKWKEHKKAIELRAHILQVHQTELAGARTTFMAFREDLERLITAASTASTANSITDDFQLQDLVGGRGTYLRIPLKSASTPDKIAAAAMEMQPDHIPSCLGLTPSSTRELYELGLFLTPGFVAGLEEKSVMQLRVLDDTLTRRRSSELSNLLATTHADWFMLVLEEGDNRRDDPVRVLIWDLKRNAVLLRARVRSQGVLLTTRILSEGTPNAAAGSTDNTADTVNDCSIASALKKLAER